MTLNQYECINGCDDYVKEVETQHSLDNEGNSTLSVTMECEKCRHEYIVEYVVVRKKEVTL